MTGSADTRHSTFQRSRYEKHLDRVHDQLVALADEVRRSGTPRADDPAAYVQAVADAQRTLAWGLANLNMDTLASAASDLTVAVDLERQGL